MQKDCNEISLYFGEVATKDQVISQAKRLIAAFPSTSKDFIILLVDRVTENEFTIERLTDAVNRIIDNSEYGTLRISDIISFDRKVKTLTYSEVLSKCSQGYRAFGYYEKIEINGKTRYIEK